MYNIYYVNLYTSLFFIFDKFVIRIIDNIFLIGNIGVKSIKIIAKYFYYFKESFLSNFVNKQ